MGYIERFHRSLKDEEIWVSEYQSLEKARTCIERYIWEYNHDRRYPSLGDRTPREARMGFESDLRIEVPSVQISGVPYTRVVYPRDCYVMAQPLGA